VNIHKRCIHPYFRFVAHERAGSPQFFHFTQRTISIAVFALAFWLLHIRQPPIKTCDGGSVLLAQDGGLQCYAFTFVAVCVRAVPLSL